MIRISVDLFAVIVLEAFIAGALAVAVIWRRKEKR